MQVDVTCDLFSVLVIHVSFVNIKGFDEIRKRLNEGISDTYDWYMRLIEKK